MERGGQAAAARLKPHGRCFIKRMGNSHVHTVEDLELGVLKRRIASALLRKGVLELLLGHIAVAAAALGQVLQQQAHLAPAAPVPGPVPRVVSTRGIGR